MFTANVETAATACNVITSEVDAAIISRYQAGESQGAIARSLGLGREAVRRILKERGIPLHPKCPVSGPHRQAILSLHAEGKSIKEISASLGLKFTTVYRVLRRQDMVKKNRKQS